jgi:hypothetical protein
VAPLDTLPGRVIGAKPAAGCPGNFALLGTGPGDSLDDLCPGSGLVISAGSCPVTARTVQGMARVRSGQAPAWPLSSGRVSAETDAAPGP